VATVVEVQDLVRRVEFVRGQVGGEIVLHGYV